MVIVLIVFVIFNLLYLHYRIKQIGSYINVMRNQDSGRQKKKIISIKFAQVINMKL